MFQTPLQIMPKWKVLDTGPAFTWQREVVISAESRELAKSMYVAQCDAIGHVPHSILVFRTR